MNTAIETVVEVGFEIWWITGLLIIALVLYFVWKDQ